MECAVYCCRFETSHTTRYHICGTCGEAGHGQVECGNVGMMESLKKNHWNDMLPIHKWCTIGTCGEDNKYHTNVAHRCVLCQKRHSERDCLRKINYHEIKCPLCRTKNMVNKQCKKIYGLSDKCVICQDNNVEILFPQCNHVLMCKQCFEDLTKDCAEPPTEEIPDPFAGLLDQGNNILGNKDGKIYCVVYAGMGCTFYVKRDLPGGRCHGFFMHTDAWGQYGPETDDRPKLEDFLRGYHEISVNQ